MKNRAQCEYLWDCLALISVDSEDGITNKFMQFPIGTHRETIWSWFEQEHDCSVVVDLMGIAESARFRAKKTYKVILSYNVTKYCEVEVEAESEEEAIDQAWETGESWSEEDNVGNLSSEVVTDFET